MLCPALSNKSDISHNHNDLYCTDEEVDTKLAADSTTDTLTLVAGSNVTITPDATKTNMRVMKRITDNIVLVFMK